MRNFILLTAIALTAVLIGGSGWRSVQGAAAVTSADIGVTADGVVHAQPDTARVQIGVEVSGSALAPADREADQRITAVVATLRAGGVADQHMRTIGMTITPQYVTQDGQQQQLTGYISRSMLEIETSDLQGVPALIDASIAAGANRVGQIQFESQALDQLRSQARDQAWQAARTQAEQLAQRAGTRLDRVTSVDEPIVESTNSIQADRGTVFSTSSGAYPSSVQSGEIEVRSRLHVVWSTQ